MKTCLVVDDSKVIRKFARAAMESLDYRVDEAVDGSDALDRCRASTPDVVLLDFNMPVMTGMAFLHAIGGAALPSRPKILFCTTENDDGCVRAAIDAGADDYLMKPFDRATLRTKLEHVGLT